MHTFRLIVEPDGRVTVPNAQPGQVVTVRVDDPATQPLTLATAATPEEQADVIASIQRLSERLRTLLRDDLPLNADELFGEDGLPT